MLNPRIKVTMYNDPNAAMFTFIGPVSDWRVVDRYVSENFKGWTSWFTTRGVR